MSAGIVNLRQARKAKARAEAERKADANRIAFGRGKSERKLSEAAAKLAERRLDGHRLGGADRAADHAGEDEPA